MTKRSWGLLVAGLVLGASLQFTLAAGSAPTGKVWYVRISKTRAGCGASAARTQDRLAPRTSPTATIAQDDLGQDFIDIEHPFVA